MKKNNLENLTSSDKLRVFILTTNDIIFLPRFFDKVFSCEQGSVVGLALVEDPNFIRFLRNSLSFMGIWVFSGEVFRQIVIRIKNLFYSLVKPSKIRSIKSVCNKYNIPCIDVKKVNVKRFREYLSAKNVNLIVSVACPQILKKALLELPSNGCINIHYGLLPAYRGMYPSFWVLANGEKETGVTVHYMAKKIDAGEIIVQLKEDIHPEDSFYTLVKRLKTTIGPEALIRALNKIKSGRVDTIKNEYEKGSYYSFPTKEAMKKFKAHGRKWY
jgi:methionyl-tRNA formyltransferase